MTAARAARWIAVAAMLLAPAAARGQAPFDMSPERGALAPPPPPAAAPAVTTPPPTEAPPALAPLVEDDDFRSFTTRNRPEGEPAGPPDGDGSGEAETARIDRYLLSGANLTFAGETGLRTWGVFLTAEQAARPATLATAFNSAIYVSPEDSILEIAINDRRILNRALLARENPTHLDVPIPPDTLRPGVNVVTFAVDQRHRTDCTMQSTYELWTEFEASGTGIVFEGADPMRLASLDELPAIGVDATGRTRIHVVAPGGERAFADTDLARLVQAIVLRGNFRQAVVSVEEAAYAGPPQGVLRILVGTADELAGVPRLPEEARSAPTVGFLDSPGAAPTLVVSGPRWQDVRAAMGYVANGVGLPAGAVRTAIDTTPIVLPPVPLLAGARTIALAELGIPTEEFSGRRFRAEFFVGLPGDFFSDAYGEATLYLDAAYTAEVRPGSRIDVYVNGFIAANTPLTSNQGDLLQHLPIKVAMTHFRPGVNTVTIEAVLETAADEVCAPGTVASGPNRFVLFDTSEFSMPAFARVERWPDLAALSGAGAPYAKGASPVALVLGRANGETYGAALTFVSAVAIGGGTVIPVEMGVDNPLPGQPAIFVGALTQFSAQATAQFGISDSARIRWDGPVRYPNAVVDIDIDPDRVVPNSFGDSSTTQGVYDRWKNQVQNPSGVYGRWVEFERWLERNFDLSFASLALFAETDTVFDPSDRATTIVAQAPKDEDRLWTLLAGQTGAELVRGTEAITGLDVWARLAGRVAAYDGTTGLQTVSANAERFTLSNDLSLNNIRLVAANWLSVNIVAYAIGLLVLCCVLGLCTTALLSRLGKRS